MQLPAAELALVQADMLRLVEPIAQELRLEIVEVLVHPAGSGVRLIVMLDRLPGRGGVRLEDCSRVSRRLTAQLDGEAPAPAHCVPSDYQLEVSSPGMSRLLRGKADLERYSGITARITIAPGGEKESITGVIMAVGDTSVTLLTGVPNVKKGAKVSPKRALEGVREVPLVDVVQMRLDPTLAEWQQLGERLAAEAKASGLVEEPETEDELGDDEDFDEDLDDGDLDGEDEPESEEEGA